MNLNSLSKGENFPTKVKDGLWAFPPRKGFDENISWWVDSSPEPVLIDCPSISKEIVKLLKELSQGRSTRILLTSRDAHGRVAELQEELQWPVVVQEQEAYLLPSINNLETFSEEYSTIGGIHLIWTPGPTPGSCVIYAPKLINVLFCGRLLIPFDSYKLASLRNRKTFHWSTQLKSIQKIKKRFPSKPFPLLASGVEHPGEGSIRLVEWNDWISP